MRVVYLCEGAKYPSSKQLVFRSSDPRMIKVFIHLLRENFDIDEKKFRCRIIHRYNQSERRLNRYWSEITKIPLSQFYKSYKALRESIAVQISRHCEAEAISDAYRDCFARLRLVRNDMLKSNVKIVFSSESYRPIWTRMKGKVKRKRDLRASIP